MLCGSGGDGSGLGCRWEVSPIGDTERDFLSQNLFKTSKSIVGTNRQLSDFWANHLKSRLQLNYVPVRKNAQRLGYKNDSDVIKDLFPESHSGVSVSRV